MFAEDLSQFFDDADFAIAAALQGVGTPINVIFDAAHLEVLGVSSANPVALAQASDVADSDIGKTLTVNAVVYTIRDRQPQDDGATVLLQLSTP
jgi:hypothetical protein